MSEAPTADKLIDVLEVLNETEESDIKFFKARWDYCNNEEERSDFIKSFRRQMIIVAANTALERS